MPQALKPFEAERTLQRVEWTVIRKLDGIMQGDYKSLFKGSGMDLAELREYQFGDDPRHIDWNVSARMRETFVKRFLEDREISAWFLVDLSPSVDFGTTTKSKRDLVVDAVAVLSRLLTRHGNRVGACLYDGNPVRVLPAGNGRNHVLRLIQELSTSPKLKKAPQTDLSVLLESTGKYVRKRSLIFIVSDFISEPGWERLLRVVGRAHELVAVRVHDPRESELPDLGPIWLEDAESGAQVYVDTHDSAFRRRFAEAARKREEQIRSTFRSAGVDALSLSTETDMVKAIVRFSELRRRRGAAGPGRAPVQNRVGVGPR